MLDERGRIVPGTYDFLFAAPGALHWKALEVSKGEGGTFGTGSAVATLYTDYAGPLPAALQGPNGEWLLVVTGLERDGLGAALRLHVQRFPPGDLPVIRRGAP